MTGKLVLLILVSFGLTAYLYGTFDREKPVYPVGKGINVITCGDKNRLEKFEVFIPAGANKEQFTKGFCNSINRENENE